MKPEDSIKQGKIIDIMPYLQRQRDTRRGVLEPHEPDQLDLIAPMDYLMRVKEYTQRKYNESPGGDVAAIEERYNRDIKNVALINVDNPLDDPLGMRYPGYLLEQQPDGSFALVPMTPSDMLDELEFRAQQGGYILEDPYRDIMAYQMALGIDNRCRVVGSHDDCLAGDAELSIIGEVPDRLYDHYPESHPRKREWLIKKKRESLRERLGNRPCSHKLELVSMQWKPRGVKKEQFRNERQGNLFVPEDSIVREFPAAFQGPGMDMIPAPEAARAIDRVLNTSGHCDCCVPRPKRGYCSLARMALRSFPRSMPRRHQPLWASPQQAWEPPFAWENIQRPGEESRGFLDSITGIPGFFFLWTFVRLLAPL
ncbi:hypothetical protein KKF84_20265 [Myxococcota bacterium]|nr:hypothetical protein [Myxococcota bacterium]